MTRRDYELLNAVLKAEFDLAKTSAVMTRSARMSAVSQCARSIATAIAAENKAFDSARFLRECGVTV